jgi:hypothetical protein
MQYENVNHILRFSLDRKFSSVDTSSPDSGDVEAPNGPSRGCIKVRVSPRSGSGSKRKKSSAKYQLRARICGGAPAVRLCAKHQPAAEHWRFALELEGDRTTVGFFFAARFHDPIESKLR